MGLYHNNNLLYSIDEHISSCFLAVLKTLFIYMLSLVLLGLVLQSDRGNELEYDDFI